MATTTGNAATAPDPSGLRRWLGALDRALAYDPADDLHQAVNELEHRVARLEAALAASTAERRA